VPDCGDVIAHGAAALSRGGRWVVLDLKAPDNAPPWLTQLGIALGRPFGSIDEWIGRRPWEGIRVAMQDALADASWHELCFGTAFLAAGSPAPGGRRVGHSDTGREAVAERHCEGRPTEGKFVGPIGPVRSHDEPAQRRPERTQRHPLQNQRPPRSSRGRR
jgi:hypothetical protein